MVCDGVEVFGTDKHVETLRILDDETGELRDCITWMKVLFNTNMTAVAYQAQVLPQKSICPMSHTSRTSGCRRQNSLVFS